MNVLKKILLLIFIIFNPSQLYSLDYVYILNDKCINELYFLAKDEFLNSEIFVNKDSRGIVLRVLIDDFGNFNEDFYDNMKKIEFFLAKIENSAIIEVHTRREIVDSFKKYKNWELSTILANRIEDIITKPLGTVEQNRINSVGYGEFMPPKNTSYNGGKIFDRIDIIILCNIGGE